MQTRRRTDKAVSSGRPTIAPNGDTWIDPLPLTQADLLMLAKAKAASAASPFISITGVAKLASASVRTVRRWQRDGLLPPRTKRSRRLEYRKSDIEVWLAAREKSRSGRGHEA